MAATEQTILMSFLLAPSSLTTVLTFQSFQAAFPRAQQSSPEIKRLYRALQHRRALITDTVAQNIDDEVERGNSQRRAVVRARRAAERQEPDEEVAVENAVCPPFFFEAFLTDTSKLKLFGSTSNLPSSKRHTLSSIIPSLEAASRDVSAELRSLEDEAASLLADITATVSSLSDLRYGRLANGQLHQEVLESLGGLKNVCDKR